MPLHHFYVKTLVVFNSHEPFLQLCRYFEPRFELGFVAYLQRDVLYMLREPRVVNVVVRGHSMVGV